MTQEAQLKACPFCGGKAQIWKAFPQFDYPWAIDVDHTEECPNAGWEGRCHKTEAEAIASWNTRTPDSVIAELVDAARGLKDDLLERAKWDGDVRVVCAGAGAWARFCNALAKLEASK